MPIKPCYLLQFFIAQKSFASLRYQKRERQTARYLRVLYCMPIIKYDKYYALLYMFITEKLFYILSYIPI